MNRFLKTKEIRNSLKKGLPSIGSWMQLSHPSIAEVMGRSGYDWVAIDLEHGSFSNHQLPDLFRALELSGTLPLVRLAEGKAKDCKLALDAGAGGVIVPMVESAEQLQEIVNQVCWPPAGKRGVGFSRANLFGVDFEDYRTEAQAPLIVAMIENIKALDVIEDILKVDGLDAILIGPYDFSASMGLTAEFSDARFKNALKLLKESCREFKVPCGIHVVNNNSDELKEAVKNGYQFLPYSMDTVFLTKSSACPSL